MGCSCMAVHVWVPHASHTLYFVELSRCLKLLWVSVVKYENRLVPCVIVLVTPTATVVPSYFYYTQNRERCIGNAK